MRKNTLASKGGKSGFQAPTISVCRKRVSVSAVKKRGESWWNFQKRSSSSSPNVKKGRLEEESPDFGSVRVAFLSSAILSRKEIKLAANSFVCIVHCVWIKFFDASAICNGRIGVRKFCDTHHLRFGSESKGKQEAKQAKIRPLVVVEKSTRKYAR